MQKVETKTLELSKVQQEKEQVKGQLESELNACKVIEKTCSELQSRRASLASTEKDLKLQKQQDML